jgi:hypothetical protein
MSNENPLKNLTLLPLRDVPAVLARCGLKSESGNPIHLSTVYRWVKCGRNGRRLVTTKIGRTRVTTPEDLIAFFPTPDPTVSQINGETVTRLCKHRVRRTRRADHKARMILGLPPHEGGE